MNMAVPAQSVYHQLTPTTPFFGRRREIAEIVQRLLRPECQLVTLTGMGGVGKTRLVTQVASELPDVFQSGVWFISLQSVASAGLLVSTLLDALGVSIAASGDPRDQLFNTLSCRDTILILDNFEHLLAEGGVELLSDLMQAAPGLKLLVTSREALQLQEEWLYPVHGMPVPSSGQVDKLEDYEVIQLFVERAHRVSPHFSLVEEREHVVRVCRLVEGIPLAVELAASWTDQLPCEVIATEIEQNLQFLHTSVRNVPGRHRSMQAVFDHSWKLLGQEERNIFQCLTIFHAGFTRMAAGEVAGASLPVLSSLVRKSMLQIEPAGRYQIHELLRQYAKEKLRESSSDQVIQLRDHHSAHYLSFLRDRSALVNGGPQLRAVEEITAELENVREAWIWASERRSLTGLIDGANTLYRFCQFSSRYVLGAQLFERAVQLLDEAALTDQPGALLLLHELGALYLRLGRLAEAQSLFERCWTTHCRLNQPPGPGHSSDPRLFLGVLSSMRGDYPKAQQLLEQALATSLQFRHTGNCQAAHYFLAGVHRAQGQYGAALIDAQSAYAVAQAAQDRWFEAYCLNEMGEAARALGQYEQAQHYYQASYAIRQEFGDPEGMAVALAYQGAVALLQGKPKLAEDLYRQSLDIYRDIGDQGALVVGFAGLGQAYSAQGQAHMATQNLRQALNIASGASFVALRLFLFVNIADLLLKVGRQERGWQLLQFVRQHVAAEVETRAQADHLLEAYRDRMPPTAFELGQEKDLELWSAELQAELAILESQYTFNPIPAQSAQPNPQALVEPLTARELEILRLLAAGHSYQEIATQLTLALGGVKSHTHNIYEKLGVSNRMQAASRAAELKLL